MLQVIVLIGRALVLAGRGHHEVVLALRQQLRALKRTTARVRVRTRDRLFWVVLARVWRNWRTALVLVQPETVVRWHRDCLRRRWTRRSTRQHGGRPAIEPQLHALVREMAAANPLWGAPRIHGELGKLGIDISERTVAPRAATASPAVTDLADLSDQSRRHTDVDRFLHRIHPHRPSSLRLRRARAPTPADCSFQHHRASDGDMGGTANH